MSKTNCINQIKELGVVPVIRAKNISEAKRAVEAIKTGGVNIFEITMTVPNAVDLIEELAATLGDEILLGAGTVLDCQTAERCLRAGAKFIVSPVLNVELVEFCREREVLMMAGAMTPTEIYTAWRAGSAIVKVFPAVAVGGADFIKSIKAPFPQIEIMVTGGVSLANAADFIKAGVAAIGVGGELVKGTEAEITAKTVEYLEIVRTTRNLPE